MTDPWPILTALIGWTVIAILILAIVTFTVAFIVGIVSTIRKRKRTDTTILGKDTQ